MIVIVGAGVVGLATAWELAGAGRDVCVLEREPRAGLGSSTHNSGVIHAGLYHPAESLKTRLCIEGRQRLYAFAERHGVPVARCGKLVVAGDAAEERALDALASNARRNAVRIEERSAAEIRTREPHIRAERGLWIPDTGWIDAEALVRALRDAAVARGAAFLPGTALVAVERAAHQLVAVTDRERIQATAIVNAAGLYADDVSRMCGGEPFRIYPCRGEYAELAPRVRHLVNGLVYPPPHPSGHGLGVHLTKTLGGAVWIGPTIAYQDSKTDYEGGRMPVEAFLEPTRRLLPGVQVSDLRLGPVGIRSKLHPASERFADFRVGPDVGQPGLYHAAGIDSPGLTASLAIAAELRRELLP